MALAKQEKDALRKEFAIHERDTGSVELQIALLTKDIKALTVHCQTHAKDFSTKRGLLKMVSQRKKFLNYLKRSNEEKYKKLKERLGLK